MLQAAVPAAESAAAAAPASLHTHADVNSIALWGAFILLLAVTMTLDLGVFHRKAHRVTAREALTWVVIWFLLAMGFNVWLYFRLDAVAAKEFLAAYLLEESLSVDNLFVFIVLFEYFAVPPAFQHRVLFWGIIGALIMRGIFIGLGALIIHQFHEVLYLFGAFLVFTGWKFLFKKDEGVHPERDPVRRLFRKVVPMTEEFEGQKFFVVREGRRLATPMLLVLVMIETTDVIFAVDSVPAVFGVVECGTPFLVYTSNIFAILGLRSMFFLLAGMMERFRYLKYGLGLVLLFVGVKMLLPIFKVTIDTNVSLAVVLSLLAGCVLTSLAVPVKSTGTEKKAKGKSGARLPPVERREHD